MLIFPVAFPSQISIYNLVNLENVKCIEKDMKNDVLSYANQHINNRKENFHFNLKENVIDNCYEYENAFLKCSIYVWFIISVITLIINIIIYFKVQKEIGNIEVTDERIINILDKCKRTMNINKKIKVFYQDSILVPSIIGVFNIKILLSDMVHRLSDNELEKILMHELSHYKRKDNIMNLVIKVIKLFYWFNPFINVFLSYIKNDIEIATDFMAMSKMDNVSELEYCETILKVAKITNTQKKYALGIVDAKKNLNDRINMIFERQYFVKHNKRMIVVTSFIVLFMCFVMLPSSYGMFKTAKTYIKDSQGKKILDLNENINNILLKEGEYYIDLDTNKFKDDIAFEKNEVNDNRQVFEFLNNNSKIYFSKGEYVCNFELAYKNSSKIEEYTFKVMVE